MDWNILCSFLSVFPFANLLSILLSYAIFCVRGRGADRKSNSPCQKLKVISYEMILFYIIFAKNKRCIHTLNFDKYEQQKAP